MLKYRIKLVESGNKNFRLLHLSYDNINKQTRFQQNFGTHNLFICWFLYGFYVNLFIMKCNIEEKLKEYRRRKENEEKAELISTKPFWEKIFPEMVTKIFKSTTCNNENAVIHAANIMEDDSNKGGVSRMNLDDVNNINSHMSTTHKVLMRKNYQGKKEVSLEKVNK